jgi:hypothetical protein
LTKEKKRFIIYIGINDYMELNAFGSVLIFLVSSFFGLIINILVFFTSVIILIIKRKKLKYLIKIILIILAIVSIIFIGFSIYVSTMLGRRHSLAIIESSDGPTAIFLIESIEINGLELFDNDYEIIGYNEHRINNIGKNTIQINFKLKVKNTEKLNILENSINPDIYVYINNEKYMAKGQLSILSTFPEGADYMFPLNSEMRIEFFESGIIEFLGYINEIE